MGRPLKILLLGDYSNCQRTLATGLRRLGCDVTVISDGTSWQQCDRDIDITRRPGKLGGLGLFLRLSTSLRRHMRGYDIVSVNDPNFVSLRPSLIRNVFDRLRRDNGGVFLNAMSTDLPFLDMLEAKDSPLRYSEWFVDGHPSRLMQSEDGRRQWEAWHGAEISDYQHYFYDNIDGAVSVLYEYHCGLQHVLLPEKIAYGGIPVDLERFAPVRLPDDIGRVRLFLGRDRTRKLLKGSDFLEEAADEVVRHHPDKAELVIVENRPFDEYVGLLKNAHVVLDQIYSYTPATTALMAMACGLCVVSGAEDEYYDFIGEHDSRPVVNAPLTVPELVRTIEDLILHPEEIAERGRLSRLFVEKHNDCVTVARRYLNFWTNRLSKC